MWNNRREYALKAQHKKEFPDILETPGIYLWTRYDPEINKTFCYVGQAKNLLDRHFHYWCVIKGLHYPIKHNEASLKAHPDWKYSIIEKCPIDKLNEREQFWIWDYMKRDNYISYNRENSLDRTQSNKKRINKIESDYRKFIGKLLSRLELKIEDIQINVKTKMNKDGKPSRVSLNSFEQLKEFINNVMKEAENEI